MDDVEQNIVIENEQIRITRFVYAISDPEEKLLAVMRLNQAAVNYAQETNNSYSLFTDISTPLHILVEEQL